MRDKRFNVIYFVLRNLFYAGERVQLGGRMKVEQFSPCNDFIVPGFLAPQEIANFIELHNVSTLKFFHPLLA